MRTKILIQLFTLALALGCSNCSKKVAQQNPDKIAVILETDMGNDIDDGLALDMLYKYLDQDKVDLLGISVNNNNAFSPHFIDIMNTWYGYPDIPIACVKNGIEDSLPANYAKDVCLFTNNEGAPFATTLPADYDFVESTKFYRQTLLQQPDSSVTVISIGFLTNLARLLDTVADSISSLNGKELVAKKVKRLVVMGGNFNGINPREYNIEKDIPASIKVFKEWPSPITVSPFEVGNQILFPGNAIKNNLGYADDQPLVEAYKKFLPMPYDRQTWDLTCVLDVVESDKGYFSYSDNGKIVISESGESQFVKDSNGKHQYMLIDSLQAKKVENRFTELISSIKSKYRK